MIPLETHLYKIHAFHQVLMFYWWQLKQML